MDAAEHRHHGHDHNAEDMAAHVELEGSVLLEFITSTAATISALRPATAAPVSSIVDIGCGPGVASCELAAQFPGSRVVAVDESPMMLARAAARAAELGVADRVETRQAVLPGGLDGLEPADVVWASMVLHHVGDVPATMRAVRSLLRADGVFAVSEFGDRPRFLPDDFGLGRPGIFERLDVAGAAWVAEMRAALPDTVVADDYPGMLAAAGFRVLDDRIVRAQLDAPLNEQGRRIAFGHMRARRHQLGDRLEADDIATLDVLLDEHDPRSVLQRPDVFVHTSRRVIIGGAA